MSEFFIAEITDTAVPLTLTLVQGGVGGVTGKAPTVAIRNAVTSNSYLDFADNTFKTVGWTTKFAPLMEVEAGHYQRSLDVSALLLPGGTVLSAEYHVDDGAGIIGDDQDLIRLVVSIDDLPSDVGGGGGGSSGGVIVVEGELYHFLPFNQTVNNPSTGTQGDRLITFDIDTLGFGKVYIESNLSIVYIEFGDATVDADVNSVRLVGGAPWTVATSGHSHMSVYASADIPITVWGIRSL